MTPPTLTQTSVNYLSKDSTEEVGKGGKKILQVNRYFCSPLTTMSYTIVGYKAGAGHMTASLWVYRWARSFPPRRC